GTLRVVASALLEVPGDPAAKAPLGILPLGSVMNVARSLGVPRELEAAAAVLAAGRTRTIDVGVVDGRGPFFEGVAIGLHAELFAAAADLDRGDAGAPLRGLREALRYRPSRIELHPVDGPPIRTRALVVSVANGPYVGLAFMVAPGARLDDGLLDTRIFERFSRWELLRHFWAIAAGRRRYEPRVRTVRTACVRIRARPAMRVRADGEDAGETPTTIRVLPAALKVLVPA
ncbi:MAG TPA: diacylglycerol kinase family protein, partial [Candidatus Limnocylindrales bacterium]|nr:diacylglycerol kinase family protein [Candidatus Limnocylindrales bacterium]